MKLTCVHYNMRLRHALCGRIRPFNEPVFLPPMVLVCTLDPIDAEADDFDGGSD